jgi:ATP-dependent Clp protease protease subunit
MSKELSYYEKLSLQLGSDIDISSRSIYLLGTSEGETLTHGDVEATLKGIHLLHEINEDPIDIYLTTSGGEDEMGLAIFDAIRSSECEVRIYCLGKCYSMGTIILQAADERLSFPSTRFMVHEGIINSGGTVSVRDLRTDLEEMDRLIKWMYDLFEERTKLSRNKMKSLFSTKDFYFTAEQALEFGFIDSIVE